MVKIFLDGASIDNIKEFSDLVDGYTTNPSLMKESGVTDYMSFAKEFITLTDGKPLSLEVLSRDKIISEAHTLSLLGENVYVKIPVDGYKNVNLIWDRVNHGYKINATAVFTIEQVKALVEDITADTPMIISIFAGRIADTGVDPIPIIKEVVNITNHLPNVEILWASTREVLNIYQAEKCGCHIITVTPSILKKYKSLNNMGLFEYSIETADQFYRDGENLVIK